MEARAAALRLLQRAHGRGVSAVVESLWAVWRRIPEAVEATRGRVEPAALQRELRACPRLVVAASGNSAYPARYLTWLLNTTTDVEATFVTPLEYALAPPRHNHVCLLVSQGARRRDSFTVLEMATRLGVPLFVLCGEKALEGRTVAAELPRERSLVTATLGEHAFLNITGTAAAFVAAWEAVTGLQGRPHEGFPAPCWEAVEAAVPPCLAPTGAVMALHGPAARCAAEAFAGYHCETLGPALSYDMKNFTHGVWRGLGESGRAAVYLVGERQTMPLARHIRERLAQHHDCAVVSAPDGVDETAVPFFLFAAMTGAFVARAAHRANGHGDDASPLTVDKTRYAGLLELTRFDVLAPDVETNQPHPDTP